MAASPSTQQANAIAAITNRHNVPIPEIEFTLHQLENGDVVSTTERVVKDVSVRSIMSFLLAPLCPRSMFPPKEECNLDSGSRVSAMSCRALAEGDAHTKLLVGAAPRTSHLPLPHLPLCFEVCILAYLIMDVYGDGVPLYTRSRQIQVQAPATYLPTDEQFWDQNDPTKPNIAFLKNHFYREGRLTEEQALYILEKCVLCSLFVT